MARTRKNARVYLFALMAVLLASCAATSRGNLPDIKGMNYHDARKVILQNGWVPVPAVRTDIEAEYRLPHFYYDAGYIEVTACSGTGMGYCDFKFRNEDGKYLKVITQGGDYAPADGSPAIVGYVGLTGALD